MRKKVHFTVSPEQTKFRWGRGTTYYFFVSSLAESKGPDTWPEVNERTRKEYENNKMDDWDSFIVELVAPILVNNITKIISGNGFRIYPPFPLNKRDARAPLFEEVGIPVGVDELVSYIQIPSHATVQVDANVNTNNSKACYGLRIDIQKGIDVEDVILFFLEICRQYTWQWWLSSPVNPFDTGVRINFDINKDYSPRDILRYHGGEDIKSTWRGIAGTMFLVGFEKAIDDGIWHQVERCMKLEYGVEDAMTFWFTAVAAHMSGEDRQCILNLALMFEVAENKSRMIRDMTDVSKNKDLLKKPIIANSQEIEIFRKIITDRDNIAH